MSTNAKSNLTARILSDAKVGTFTGLVVTKKGTERGPKGAKVLYGNDLVHVCIFTGFRYQKLCRRSLETLSQITDAEILAEIREQGLRGWQGRGAKAVEVDITLTDIADARAELAHSLTDSEAGVNSSTTDHVYDPLIVNGEHVRGCRVYKCVAEDPQHQCKCRNCTNGPKAPLPGTIYLQGLQVSSRVLTPAPNGPAPASQSAAKTVAKDVLRRRLPISRYVSYALEPGTDFLLRAGGTAELEAEKAGIHFTEAVRDAIRRSKAA